MLAATPNQKRLPTQKEIRITEILEEAVSQHKTGNLEQAYALYKRVRNSDPKNVIALQLSGVLAAQRKEPDLSLNFFSRAIALNNTYVDAFYNRGNVLKDLRRYDEALKDYNKAISLKSDYVNAFFSRGNTYREIGNFKSALNDYIRVIDLDPNHARAYLFHGMTSRELGLLAEAITSYSKAVSIKDDFADAYFNRACIYMEIDKFNDAICDFDEVIAIDDSHLDALINRGAAFHKTDQLKKALEDYNQVLSVQPNSIETLNNRGIIHNERGNYKTALLDFNSALDLDPDYAEALNHRGVAFKELKRFDEALEDYNKALTLKPDYADALNNRGVVYREFGRLNEALADYSKAIELVPDYAEVYNNRGTILKDLKQFDEALADFDKATALKPDYAGAYWNKSLYWLLLGDFKTGWPLYEWRWKSEKHIGEPITTSKPLWNNQDSKNVLLWAEQGIGDEIMFASLIRELHAKCAKLIVQCDPRLIPLFKRSFPKDIEFYDKNDLVPESLYEFHIPMGSLAPILRPSIESFAKGAKPYLFCQNEQALELRKRITGNKDNTLIGISWSSKSTIPAARHRNISLADIARLLNKPGTTLVSLQYGDVSNEIDDLKKHHNIDVIEVSDIDIYNNIDGLSALISACDHVVSTDNATVHLAGALGADTHVLLPVNQDWRWGLESSKSYWYETLKLYRQETLGEWNQTLKNLEMKLAH
ncbi:tetratricopeptide repeat protein [Alphaproteobacteria bacterium LSUCC0226]